MNILNLENNGITLFSDEAFDEDEFVDTEEDDAENFDEFTDYEDDE